MSYDLHLADPVTGEVLCAQAPHQMAGGTYVLGGTDRLELNVTYNYGAHIRDALGDERGIRALYGLTGAESLPLLDRGIAALDDDAAEDYWAATEGNAKRALCQLRALAQLRPDGVWAGD